MRLTLLALALMAVCGGCAVSQEQLMQNAERIAARGHLQRMEVVGGAFRITTYARLSTPGKPVRFYIEGDGKAWIARRRVSLNPTPHDPVALKLAAIDDGENVVYLARPCQFVHERHFGECNPHHWTDQRYSPGVVASLNQVVDHFVGLAAADGVELVGFSGGGALAVLVAAQRKDVAAIRTVAANLDIDAFASLHQISPLSGSLNPSDFASAVAATPQLHLVGERDPVVPRVIAEQFRSRAGKSSCVAIRTIAGATHRSGWPEQWPALVKLHVGCATP